VSVTPPYLLHSLLEPLHQNIELCALDRDPRAESIKVTCDDVTPEIAALGLLAPALQRHGDVADFRFRIAIKLDGGKVEDTGSLVVVGGSGLLGLLLRLSPLIFQTTMIDTPGMACALQCPVDGLLPCPPPMLDQSGLVPATLLLPEPVTCDLAHGQHNMRMDIPVVALSVRRMDGDVGDHAPRDEGLAHVALHQEKPLRGI